MPDLDVTDVILDPMFAETLTVIRRQQSINALGRVTLTTTTISPAPVGVVLAQADAALVRGPDQQTLPRLLQVHTTYRLRSTGVDVSGNTFQPDVIVWNGDQYVVNKIQDFSRFGVGFIQADCSSMALADHVPV